MLLFMRLHTVEIDPGALVWLQENARTTDRTAFGKSYPNENVASLNLEYEY